VLSMATAKLPLNHARHARYVEQVPDLASNGSDELELILVLVASGTYSGMPCSSFVHCTVTLTWMEDEPLPPGPLPVIVNVKLSGPVYPACD
jgi:hypothetical protein